MFVTSLYQDISTVPTGPHPETSDEQAGSADY